MDPLNREERIKNKTGLPEPAHPEFETTDLNLASFLRCRTFTIVRLKRQNETRTIFVFEDSPELRRAIVDYANDGEVPVRTYCNTLRDLKGITR